MDAGDDHGVQRRPSGGPVQSHYASSGHHVFPPALGKSFEDLVALRAQMKAEGARFADVAFVLREGVKCLVGGSGDR
jgi:hypothetical protein